MSREESFVDVSTVNWSEGLQEDTDTRDFDTDFNEGGDEAACEINENGNDVDTEDANNDRGNNIDDGNNDDNENKRSNESGNSVSRDCNSDEVKRVLTRGKKFAQIERDYRNGFACEFRTEVPRQLEGKLPNSEFIAAIESINAITVAADRIDSAAVFENLLGCLSCYTSLWCMRTKWQKAILELDDVIESMNRSFFLPYGFLLVHPKQNGFRLIDVVVTSE